MVAHTATSATYACQPGYGTRSVSSNLPDYCTLSATPSPVTVACQCKRDGTSFWGVWPSDSLDPPSCVPDCTSVEPALPAGVVVQPGTREMHRLTVMCAQGFLATGAVSAEQLACKTEGGVAAWGAVTTLQCAAPVQTGPARLLGCFMDVKRGYQTSFCNTPRHKWDLLEQSNGMTHDRCRQLAWQQGYTVYHLTNAPIVFECFAGALDWHEMF